MRRFSNANIRSCRHHLTTLERGLYEVLLTEALEEQLGDLDGALEPIRSVLRAPEAADRIALHLARVIERAVDSIAEGERTNLGLDLARRLIDLICKLPSAAEFGSERPGATGDVLHSLVGRLPDGRPDFVAAPLIPLLDVYKRQALASVRVEGRLLTLRALKNIVRQCVKQPKCSSLSSAAMSS